MTTDYRLIWRNIWRNRRRTVITLASVFFAVFFCVIMMGFTTGMWDRMLENMLKTQTGHIQIHAEGYWDDKVIDNFMFMDAATIARLESIDNIENVSPRLETFAMAAAGTVSKGVAVIGVSPAKEAQKSNLPSRIVKGGYLSETDDGILIGEGLANYLNITTGDTLALIGQGYHGASAAGLFPIRGILKLMTTEMDNGLIYTTLPTAQNFIDMPDGYSGILISIKDNDRLQSVVDSVKSLVGSRQSVVGSNETTDHTPPAIDYKVLTWHFTMERLMQQGETDKAFNMVLMCILYLIVGFGILGTVIMMTNERKREFCMMISLGMSRIRLSAITVIEMIVKSLIGVMAAIVVTLPIAHWFSAHPIKMTGGMAEMLSQYGMEPYLPMATHSHIFTNPIIIILLMVLLTVIYPVRKILKLELSKNK
ncbi:MAG: ABC transporter permease [Tannerella sp.]|jgi:ABC-type lipoprotein release transport system permease subunit|nr:ABC transporter permease [Tannerella sp.]